jgi:DNA-binding helix-hairpin-helix protein with protein kinase domain
MTGKGIAEVLFNEPATRRSAGAAPTRRAARIWPGALLLVGQRPQRVFSLLAPRTQPKFAAALLYEPQTWRTISTFCRR